MAEVSIVGDQLALCGSDGFTLYDFSSMRPTKKLAALGSVAQVALLAMANVAAVLLEHKRRVVLYDLDNDTRISDMYFDCDVLAVRLNPKRLVVVQAEMVHQYDLQTLDPLPQIRTSTPPNVDGLVALSTLTPDGKCVVAVPQSGDVLDTSRGDVFLVDSIGFASVTVVCAHRTRVTHIAFSQSSNCFATASLRGNVIRVFTLSGVMLYSFKRGNSAATIYGLALSGDGAMAACTSSSGTLHVFNGADADAAKDKEARSFSKTDVGTTRSMIQLSADGRNLWLVHPPGGASRGGVDGSPSEGEKTRGSRFGRLSSAARDSSPGAGGLQPCRVTRYVIDEGKTKFETEHTVP
jgi:WD40 repeat protein